jgi:hypothetical protein
MRAVPALSETANRRSSRRCSRSTVKPTTSRYQATLAARSSTVNDA